MRPTCFLLGSVHQRSVVRGAIAAEFTSQERQLMLMFGLLAPFKFDYVLAINRGDSPLSPSNSHDYPRDHDASGLVAFGPHFHTINFMVKMSRDESGVSEKIAMTAHNLEGSFIADWNATREATDASRNANHYLHTRQTLSQEARRRMATTTATTEARTPLIRSTTNSVSEPPTFHLS